MKTNQEIREFILGYSETKKVIGLKVSNNDTNYFHKYLKKIGKVLEIPSFQRILVHNENEKIIIVNEDFKLDDLQLEQRQKVTIQNLEIKLNYKNIDNQRILNLFTRQHPQRQKYQNTPFPNSFETVGHMAHYNLTHDQQIFKEIIGQITLLKCPNIKTVVAKTQKLHNVYRTPTLQHMAGQKNYLVKLKEQGVQFTLDFQKVYWCSRLQQERDRILLLMKPRELLADIFCGVGPLAVRAAKKGLYVIANDLNPFCFQYLNINCKLNQVTEKVKCWNMCARQAMRKIYSENQNYKQQFKYPDHIYMNLPVDAIQFLDVFTNYGANMKTNKMPLVHVNCFVVADSDQKSKQILEKRIDKVLPGFKKQEIIHMHHIKNVTVIMRMYCISIKIAEKYERIENEREQAQEQGLDKMKKKVKLE